MKGGVSGTGESAPLKYLDAPLESYDLSLASVPIACLTAGERIRKAYSRSCIFCRISRFLPLPH